MKRITLLLLLVCSTASAREFSLSEMLEWKYGPVACTEQVDPSDLTSQFPAMKITCWNSEEKQPDENQIKEDIQEYQDYLILKESVEKEQKKAVIQKFNLTEDDINTFKRVLRE